MGKQLISIASIGLMILSCQGFAKPLIHDAEYAVIEAQNGKAWTADNKTIDKKISRYQEEKWW